MKSVHVLIPEDQFVFAMTDMGEWLAEECISVSHFNYKRTDNGDLKFRAGFMADGDADDFIKRFGGKVAIDGFPLSVRPAPDPKPDLAVRSGRTNLWAPRRLEVVAVHC